MKALFLTLATVITLSAGAQMKSLFYGQSWKDVSKVADSIKAALPAYHLDSTSMTKSGRALTLFFSNGSGEALTASILKGNQGADEILTMSLTGPKEAVLALYDQYFGKSQPETPSQALQMASLPSGQTLPVACYQDTRRPSQWVLSSRNPY
jgi:hypothetical protein